MREKFLSHRSSGTTPATNKFINSKRNTGPHNQLKLNFTEARNSVSSRFSAEFLRKRKSLAYSPKKLVSSTTSASQNQQLAFELKQLPTAQKSPARMETYQKGWEQKKIQNLQVSSRVKNYLGLKSKEETSLQEKAKEQKNEQTQQGLLLQSKKTGLYSLLSTGR